MTTKIRSSQQLYIDDNLAFNSKKGVGLAPGTASGDAVEFAQMNTAIANAGVGVGSSIHVPVADLAAAKAINAAGRADKMIMLIESLGLYRYDAENLATSNDGTVIRPTDLASDSVAGRWLKMSSILTDHSLLNNLLGNGEYHLSLAERDKLLGIETGAQVTNAANITTALNGTATDTTPLDADLIPMLDSSASFGLRKISWTSIKAFLKTYFDTLYDMTAAKARANHTGTQTASTISDFSAAALTAAPAETAATTGTLIAGATAKATPVDADVLPISDSAASNILKKFTWLNLKQTLFSAFSGDVTVSSSGVAAIGANKVTNAMLATMSANTIKGSVAGGNAADLTVAQLKTMLGLVAGNLSVRTYHATPTGAVNGSNCNFVIPFIIASGTEAVFKNGFLHNAGAGNDYTIAYNSPAGSSTITFLTAPSNTPFTDVILVDFDV